MKNGFPLFKWTFFAVLFLIVGVIVSVAVMSNIRKGHSSETEVSVSSLETKEG